MSPANQPQAAQRTRLDGTPVSRAERRLTSPGAASTFEAVADQEAALRADLFDEFLQGAAAWEQFRGLMDLHRRREAFRHRDAGHGRGAPELRTLRPEVDGIVVSDAQARVEPIIGQQGNVPQRRVTDARDEVGEALEGGRQGRLAGAHGLSITRLYAGLRDC